MIENPLQGHRICSCSIVWLYHRGDIYSAGSVSLYSINIYPKYFNPISFNYTKTNIEDTFLN